MQAWSRHQQPKQCQQFIADFFVKVAKGTSRSLLSLLPHLYIRPQKKKIRKNAEIRTGPIRQNHGLFPIACSFVARSGQRSLYTWKYFYYLREQNFLQHEFNFESISVTELLVTHSTIRYQMKGMDIIFLLTPLSYLWALWFEYYSLSKSRFFSKWQNQWKITNFAQPSNSTFGTLFFKRLPFLYTPRFWFSTFYFPLVFTTKC